MNITRANTEPFYRFHRTKEEFQRVIRVSVGALHFSVRSARAGDREGLTVLPTGGEPWGDLTKWKSLKRASTETTRFLAQMGLVRVMSAFEDFLICVKAEYDRYRDLKKSSSKGQSKTKIGESSIDQLEPLLMQLEWHSGPIEFLIPLYKYFLAARHCIVHRSARASEMLVGQANSKELSASHSKWPGRRGRPLPALPIVQLNEEIPLLPRHSVLAGEVCYRAAKYLNLLLVGFLGEDGLVYMAAHHSLLADERVPTQAKNSVERILNQVLDERYRVTKVQPGETIRVLKSLDRWTECRRRYERLYPKRI